jgi:hypothetical protein
LQRLQCAPRLHTQRQAGERLISGDSLAMGISASQDGG